jgi:Na+-driven multidrug efflux pump
MFGGLGALLRGQGLMVLVNKSFGPAANAAASVANQMSGKTLLFSKGFIGSFAPAITNACGAKDFKRMHTLAFMTCKFGTMLTLLFALPLSIELPLIVNYWLKNPPQYAVGLCWCVMATTVIDQTATGHKLAVNANGKIAMYQAVLGTILMLSFPIAWILIVCDFGVYSIGYAAIIATALCALGRVFFARSLVEMPIRYWAYHIILPLSILVAVSLSIGFLPRLFMPPHWLRIIVSAILLEIAFAGLGWFIVFSTDEKAYVLSRGRQLYKSFIARYD